MRELRNTIERAVLLYEGKDLLFTLEDAKDINTQTAESGLQANYNETPWQSGKAVAQSAPAAPSFEPRGRSFSGGFPAGGRSFGETALTVTAQAKNSENSQVIFNTLPALGELKQAYVEHIFSLTGGKVDGQDGLAIILGLSRASAYRLLNQYRLSKKTTKATKVKQPNLASLRRRGRTYSGSAPMRRRNSNGNQREITFVSGREPAQKR